MVNILVDAFALACPSSSQYTDKNQLSEAFNSFLKNIISWRYLNKNNCLRLVSNNDIALTLEKTEAYPHWTPISAALSALNLEEEYQTKDIIDVINSILTKVDTIEDIIEVKDVLCDATRFVPEELNLREIHYVNHLERLLGLLQLDKHGKLTHPLIASKIKTPCNMIDIETTIVCVDHYDPNETTSLPISVKESIPFVSCFSTTIKQINPHLLWKHKIDDYCRNAIEIYIANELSIDYEDVLIKFKNWSFGKDFLASVENLDFFNDTSRFNKLAFAVRNTILREKLRDIHALRSGQSGNAPQIERDTYVAQRRDVDTEFHLHFWDNGKHIEIANLVTHNDFKIS